MKNVRTLTLTLLIHLKCKPEQVVYQGCIATIVFRHSTRSCFFFFFKVLVSIKYSILILRNLLFHVIDFFPSPNLEKSPSAVTSMTIITRLMTNSVAASTRCDVTTLSFAGFSAQLSRNVKSLINAWSRHCDVKGGVG